MNNSERQLPNIFPRRKITEGATDRKKFFLIRDSGNYHLYLDRGLFQKKSFLTTVSSNDLSGIDRIFDKNASKRLKLAISKVIRYDNKLPSFYPELNVTRGRKIGKWELIPNNPEIVNKITF